MTKPWPETIGRRVRAARRRRGVRKGELARAIGISVMALGQIEQGKTQDLGRHVIQQIAHVLRVKAAYLLGVTDDAPDEAPHAVTVVGFL